MRIRIPILAFAFALLPALAPALTRAQDFDPAGEAAMLARIDALRSERGLSPLAREPRLDAAARAHCIDMAAQGQLTHVSERTGTPADRVRVAGVSASTVSENVAQHRSTAEAQQSLVESDAHRANMVAPTVTHVGLASLRTPRGVYVTQVFATLAVEMQAPVAPPVSSTAPAPLLEAPAILTPPAVVSESLPSSPPVDGQPPRAPVESSLGSPDDGCFSPLPGLRVCDRGTSSPRPPAPAASNAPVENAPPLLPVSPPWTNDCFSPLPGLRVCGPSSTTSRRPPPAPVAPVAPPPLVQPPMAPPVATPSQAPVPSRWEIQPGSNGSVVLQYTPEGSLIGYWVFSSGRWWFFPVPVGAMPGQRLEPDLRVTEPPPGFPMPVVGQGSPSRAPLVRRVYAGRMPPRDGWIRRRTATFLRTL
jgi:hypothetical protein